MSGASRFVVIGASAGGLQALNAIIRTLPASLPAALVIVVHRRTAGGILPQILSRHTPLVVVTAADRMPIAAGTIYVAPNDRHVLIGEDGLRVVRGPRENGFRPAVDPLFRSAARVGGAAVIGVVLSGALDDGSCGLSAIVRAGGTAFVQDPDDAEVPSMPRAALRQTHVHGILPADRLGAAIVRACHDPPRRQSAAPELSAMSAPESPEPQQPADDTQVADMEALNGPPTPITCPACGGALWETTEGGVLRYACHVGHQYAPDSLLAEHGEAVEHALWTAVRILEQHAELRQRMAARAEAQGLALVADGFVEDGRDYHAQAQAIRRLVFGQHDRVAPGPTEDRRRARAR